MFISERAKGNLKMVFLRTPLRDDIKLKFKICIIRIGIGKDIEHQLQSKMDPVKTMVDVDWQKTKNNMADTFNTIRMRLI